MSETEEVKTEEMPKTPMQEAAAKVELDEGAAVVFIGVDECYQNYADPTHMPLNSPSEVKALVDNGTLEVIEVDGESRVTGNVGVLGGQDQVANSDVAPDAVLVDEFPGDEEVEDEGVEDGDVVEETEEVHDRDVAPVAEVSTEPKKELDF